jgi:hypothetical protein
MINNIFTLPVYWYSKLEWIIIVVKILPYGFKFFKLVFFKRGFRCKIKWWWKFHVCVSLYVLALFECLNNKVIINVFLTYKNVWKYGIMAIYITELNWLMSQSYILLILRLKLYSIWYYYSQHLYISGFLKSQCLFFV